MEITSQNHGFAVDAPLDGATQAPEERFGRVRDPADRWGPRKLDLDLRLGEGTGALLAVPLLAAAASTLAEMATFESAGVSDRDA